MTSMQQVNRPEIKDVKTKIIKLTTIQSKIKDSQGEPKTNQLRNLRQMISNRFLPKVCALQ